MKFLNLFDDDAEIIRCDEPETEPVATSLPRYNRSLHNDCVMQLIIIYVQAVKYVKTIDVIRTLHIRVQVYLWYL